MYADCYDPGIAQVSKWDEIGKVWALCGQCRCCPCSTAAILATRGTDTSTILIRAEPIRDFALAI